MLLVGESRPIKNYLSELHGKNKLVEIMRVVFLGRDLNALLNEEHEHLFQIDLDNDIVKEYLTDGLLIEASNFYPIFDREERIFNIHTHPLRSLQSADLASSAFPSIVDLFSLLEATIYFSSNEGSYTPCNDYILGWDQGEIKLICYRFHEEIIDFIFDSGNVEEEVDAIKRNLEVAYNIVLSDEELKRDFVGSMLKELNTNVGYGNKVLSFYGIDSDEKYTGRRRRSHRR
jgi:hypothetical protein